MCFKTCTLAVLYFLIEWVGKDEEKEETKIDVAVSSVGWEGTTPSFLILL